VKFSHEAKNIDPFILGKLLKEMPGIFNRAIAAYYTLTARGDFVESQSSIARLSQYKNEIDPTANWLEDSITIHPLGNGHDESKINFNDLYENYKKQFDEKEFNICNETQFIKKLTKLVPNYSERSLRILKEGKRIRMLKGITLKDFEEPPY
jgi:phage/plasmid-associated DNA primase